MKIVDIERYYCLVLRRFRESEGHILLGFSARVPFACLKAWTKSMSIPMSLRRRLMADLIAFKVFLCLFIWHFISLSAVDISFGLYFCIKLSQVSSSFDIDCRYTDLLKIASLIQFFLAPQLLMI